MMFTVLLHRWLAKSHLEKITKNIQTIQNLRESLFKRNFVSVIKSNVDSNVVLYKLEKPKYFFYMKLLSGINCLFWVTTGIQGFESFKDADAARTRLGLGDSFLAKFYTSSYIGAFAVIFGIGTSALMSLYVSKSIRKVILNKGGRSVTIITYSLPGFKNQLKVPISEISAINYKRTEKGFFPLKVKNKWFYYLIDCEGQVTNETLFKSIFGVRRHLK